MNREGAHLRSVLLAASSLLTAVPAGGATESSGAPKAFAVARAGTAPIIDGILNDPAWLDAMVVDDFHQHTPVYLDEPTERTVVRVLYDSNYLYVAADLFDSDPDEINATQLIQGRTISSDDRFFVALDTFNSRRNDYLFEVNANGVRREALRESNSRSIENWTAIWYAESARTERGWSAEIAIPFKSISFSPDSKVWGVNFGRWVTRKQEFALWSSNERLWWAAESGLMHGLEDLDQGIGLDVVPSINLRQRRDIPAGTTEQAFDPSLDAFYRVTPSLNATLTINTDFSATEADERQIALDRFSIFFPEKRDFFLQDAGIFEFGNITTNGRPFFSRRIGLGADGRPIGIDLGGKLTGRIGRFNLGVLGIRQEAHGDTAASDLFVARASANVLSESVLGIIMTDGDPTSNVPNTLLGADFLYRDSDGLFGQVMSGSAWFQTTDSPGMDSDSDAYGVGFDLPNDRFQVQFAASEIQENYRPALGFANRTGIRQYELLLRNRIRPKESRWREADNMVEAVVVSDLHGDIQSQLVRLTPVSLRSTGGDLIFIDWERARERVQSPFTLFGRLEVPAGEYVYDRYRAELSTGVQRPISAVLSFQDGGFFHGTRQERSVELQWRSSGRFFLGAALTENIVRLPSGSFTARLASLRTDVAFDSRWSLSNMLQYDNVADAAALNTRLRFEPRSGRELLLALNHGVSTPAEGIVSTDNEVVLRFSYTFRY